MFLVKGVKSSLQRELDSFYKEVMGGDFNIRQITKGGFSRSRAKLNPSAFVELNDNLVGTFYEKAPYLVWHGMRLLAIDGSRIDLPKHKSIVEEFGEHGFGPQAKANHSLGTVSLLYDPLNLITLDAQLAGYSSSERTLLDNHLEKVQAGDLLLLDRWYASLGLMFELQARGIDFCMRMKANWWLSAKEFASSGEKERIVNFALPAKDHHLLERYPGRSKDYRCRLICVDLPNGEKEILCTSLLDADTYKHADFVELYHFRWNIEEAYKLFKGRAEVEYFSGKTARAVRQDFYAKVFMMSLCAVLAFPIEERVKNEYQQEKAKHPRKINRTNALAMTSSISVGLFLTQKVKAAIKAFDQIVANTTEIIRPGRKFERKKMPKRSYHMNYKRL